MSEADHGHEEEEVLAADEAPTPLWLTLLGAGLLLLVAILYVAGQ
jgi:hypothetical protein